MMGSRILPGTVYVEPDPTAPEWSNLPTRRSLISQVPSLERYTASVHRPLAGLAPEFLTVQVATNDSPTWAAARSDVIVGSTTRFDGSCGSTIRVGGMDWALFDSLSDSKTSPRGRWL